MNADQVADAEALARVQAWLDGSGRYIDGIGGEFARADLRRVVALADARSDAR